MGRAIPRWFFTHILISSLSLSLGCGLPKNEAPSDSKDAGEKVVPPCEHPASHYRATPAAACASTAFTCPTDQGAFFDLCGCGCTWASNPDYRDSRPPANPERGAGEPSECGGPAGPFVRFATGTKRVVVGEDAVYIWVDPKRADPLNNPGPEEVLWRVDKKTRGLTVVPDASQVIPETALVKVEEKSSPQISGAYSFTVKGSALGDDHLCLYRIPLAGGPPEMVFAFPPSGRGTSWFIVVGDDFYGTDNDGSLWHASALPGGAPPALIEQRGAYDDDDYSPLLGADRDVVYWQAGADPDLYTADGAPMMLFRKCRTSP